ncbi:Hypothetical predicted protein [Scomber scombrus]|uniref:Uncharacterized protein n=1 Tax=Scomber scombrus TaxID=13677 RepID=A0AAV1PPK1_SCOSC
MREEDAAGAPELQRSAPPPPRPATLLPRPAVPYSGLAEGGRAAVQQEEHRGEAEVLLI